MAPSPFEVGQAPIEALPIRGGKNTGLVVDVASSRQRRQTRRTEWRGLRWRSRCGDCGQQPDDGEIDSASAEIRAQDPPPSLVCCRQTMSRIARRSRATGLWVSQSDPLPATAVVASGSPQRRAVAGTGAGGLGDRPALAEAEGSGHVGAERAHARLPGLDGLGDVGPALQARRRQGAPRRARIGTYFRELWALWFGAAQPEAWRHRRAREGRTVASCGGTLSVAGGATGAYKRISARLFSLTHTSSPETLTRSMGLPTATVIPDLPHHRRSLSRLFFGILLFCMACTPRSRG